MNNPQPVDPTTINPGERALAVVGVRAVVSRAVEKVTADQRRAIAAYDKLIRKRARELVADEIRCAWPEPPSYRALLRDLTQPFDQHQVEQMFGALRLRHSDGVSAPGCQRVPVPAERDPARGVEVAGGRNPTPSR